MHVCVCVRERGFWWRTAVAVWVLMHVLRQLVVVWIILLDEAQTSTVNCKP